MMNYNSTIKNYKKSPLYKCVFYNEFVDRRDQSVTLSGWFAHKTINNVRWKSIRFETERQAAIALDKHLINNGLQPINVLKPKQVA